MRATIVALQREQLNSAVMFGLNGRAVHLGLGSAYNSVQLTTIR